MKRRQRNYIPTRKVKGAPAGDPVQVARPSLATIDMSAGLGRKGISVGSRVTIMGTGLYAGQVAVVERLVGGVIPAAVVRTDAGQTRHARTIDLEPYANPASEAKPKSN
jgi:hypothetical protein